MAFGIEVNFMGASENTALVIVLLVVAAGAKMVGSWVATRKIVGSMRERVLITSGNLHQGEMGM